MSMGSQGYKLLPEWKSNLARFIQDLLVRNKKGEVKFSWDPSIPDSYNCLTFGSHVVMLQTGIDPYKAKLEAAGLEEPEYTTALEAFRQLYKMGYKGLDQLIGSMFPEIELVQAQLGDILLIPAIAELPEEVEGMPTNGLRYATAFAAPPHFWCISSAYGLSRGSIFELVKTAKNYNPRPRAFRVGRLNG